MAGETLNHPQLGEIHGKKGDGVVQFLGLKYATLKDRFAPPELVTSYNGPVDATRFGPQALGPPHGIDIEFSLIQQALEKPEFPGMSDVDSLNLNITCPATGGSNLPVMVFIAGGGFMLGGNWFPQWDFGRLVKLSAEQGTPFIGVLINYRLGAPGFLHSKEMQDAGYLANNGLRDQRTALQWVKKYTQGFGGDPNNVTVSGQSAGSFSAISTLYSEEPLAKRVIGFGGCPPFLNPLPPEVSEANYAEVLKALDLESLPPAERISALVSTPAEKLLTSIPPTVPLRPVLDEDILPGSQTFETVAMKTPPPECPMPGKQWCEALMVADSGLDASVFAFMALLARKEGIGAAFAKSAKNTLSTSPATADALLKHYALDSATSDDESMVKIVQFASDIAFYAATTKFASGFPCKTYVLHFNERNPWDGMFKGHATHIMDVAFLFQNYNGHLSAEQQTSADQLGRDVIAFVNGKEPWDPFQEKGVVAVLEGGKRELVADRSKETGRDQKIFELAKDVGLDALMGVWENFLRGA